MLMVCDVWNAMELLRVLENKFRFIPLIKYCIIFPEFNILTVTYYIFLKLLRAVMCYENPQKTVSLYDI